MIATPVVLPGMAVGPSRPIMSVRTTLEDVSEAVDVEVELLISMVVVSGFVRCDHQDVHEIAVTYHRRQKHHRRLSMLL